MLGGYHPLAVAAGIASGLLFVLAAKSVVPSLLLVYTPFLPLLAAGLSLGAPSVLLASGIASGVSALMGLDALLFYLLMFAVPTVYFLRKTLSQVALTPTHRVWFPQGGALSDLACYAAIIVAALAGSMHAALGGADLSTLLPPVMEGEPEAMASIRSWMTEKAFLILGGTAWIQLAMFYGMAVLVNFMLAGYRCTLRPDLSLIPFIPGGWLLVALLGTGVLSFVEDPSAALAAKAAFITLLFPYFLMGIALLHRYSLLWPGRRRLWLALVYFFMLMFPFLALGFIGLGLAAQARRLSNRSSGQIS